MSKPEAAGQLLPPSMSTGDMLYGSWPRPGPHPHGNGAEVRRRHMRKRGLRGPTSGVTDGDSVSDSSTYLRESPGTIQSGTPARRTHRAERHRRSARQTLVRLSSRKGKSSPGCPQVGRKMPWRGSNTVNNRGEALSSAGCVKRPDRRALRLNRQRCCTSTRNHTVTVKAGRLSGASYCAACHALLSEGVRAGLGNPKMPHLVHSGSPRMRHFLQVK